MSFEVEVYEEKVFMRLFLSRLDVRFIRFVFSWNGILKAFDAKPGNRSEFVYLLDHS